VADPGWEEKKKTRNKIAVAGLIAEPTGTDGHRTIGRTWHASHLKNCRVAEAISSSTRNTLPLYHPEMILSPLPLTIRGFWLCLATLKLYLILAGRSRPRNGEPWSSVLNKGKHCDRSPMITACPMRRSGECCVPRVPLSGTCVPDHSRCQDTSCSVSRSR